MATEIRIPVVDETTETVRIIRWIKKKGDCVIAGDVLLEVETDKTTMEIESFVDGTLLNVLAAENETVPVNKIIAIVG